MKCQDCYNCLVTLKINKFGRFLFNDFASKCRCKEGLWVKGDGSQDTIALDKVMGNKFKYQPDYCDFFKGE